MVNYNCICNINFRIIASYVYNKTNSIEGLFDGLEYPTARFASAEEFFLKDEEWTTLRNFRTVFIRARERVNEPNFFYNCGLSAARLQSWGKLQYFAKLFLSPSDGFKKLPFLNQTFNDTKIINVLKPPSYDKSQRLMRITISIKYNDGFDPNEDLMGDLYTQGIIASIPCVWGLPPATIKTILAPYDPIQLVAKDFYLRNTGFRFAWQQNRLLFSQDPMSPFREVGHLVELVEEGGGNEGQIYLGLYKELPYGKQISPTQILGLLLTDELNLQEITFKRGQILMGPYFVFEFTYEPLSFSKRLVNLFYPRSKTHHAENMLIETINQLKEKIRERNRAYEELELLNKHLNETNQLLLKQQNMLEDLVKEKTKEIELAKEELARINQRLCQEVEEKTKEIEILVRLKKHFSPTVIKHFLEKPEEIEKFKRKLITITFVDIRGFTVISEITEPEDLLLILNRFYEKMIAIAHSYDGTINKIMGDGLLILFNDIYDMDDHALRAVRMAVDMQKAMVEINKELEPVVDRLGIGIGINTGHAFLGPIGSNLLKDYTVIGKEVNITTRIQSMAQPGEILLTKRTLSFLADRVVVEFLKKVPIKGVSQPVEIYRLIEVR